MRFFGIIFLGVISQNVMAQDYSGFITEEYLRSEFTFGTNEVMKYEVCKKKSYPTCDYVWGKPAKRDATRIKYGMAPEGKKVMVIYAQAMKAEDFERSIAVYTDAEQIEEIGVRSVWSSNVPPSLQARLRIISATAPDWKTGS